MEENTLELSFEVDVSEGDEEEDRNYSLDSDNDDGDLGDFDPEAGENQYPDADGMSQCNCSQPDRVVVHGAFGGVSLSDKIHDETANVRPQIV